MGISFNNPIAARYIYRRTGGVFTSIGGGTSVFDYFADSPSVNDAIYFCATKTQPYSGANPWKDLTIRIGTPRTNTGACQWEYIAYLAENFVVTTGTELISSMGIMCSKAQTGDMVELHCATPPAPLQNNTPYYVRVVSSWQVSLHPTAADAAANTNIIDLTTSGSSNKMFLWKPLTAVDPSNTFTAPAGSYTIEFDLPDDWFPTNYTVSLSSLQWEYWIRCRVTDTGSGIIEGGANSTTGVTCGDFSYTADNYSSGSPCDFLALYAADQAAGRNLIEMPCKDVVLMKCGLIIGAGVNTTYFTDYGKVVVMGGAIYVSSQGRLTLGQSDSNKPYNGCQILFRHPVSHRFFNLTASSSYAYLYLYNCDIRGYTYFITRGYNCTQVMRSVNFNTWIGEEISTGGTPNFGGDQILDRITLHRIGEGFRFTAAPGASASYDDIKVSTGNGGSYRAMFCGWLSATSTDFNIRNLVIEGVPANSIYLPGNTFTNVNWNIIDPTNFNYLTVYADGTLNNAHVNEIYSLNYTVLDPNGLPIENALVTVTNAIGTFTGTTEFDGSVSVLVTVNRRTLPSTNIPGGVCTIRISKPGYVTIADKTLITSKVTDTKTLRPVLRLADLGV